MWTVHYILLYLSCLIVDAFLQVVEFWVDKDYFESATVYGTIIGKHRFLWYTCYVTYTTCNRLLFLCYTPKTNPNIPVGSFVKSGR